MGLLSAGTPLTWEETKKYTDHVRKHGIQQFINLYYKLKDRPCDTLKWGDEIEYIVVKQDHENKKARVFLVADRLLPVLQELEKSQPSETKTTWAPEYASYMVEGVPGKPYGGLMAHFNTVEANMKLRRQQVLSLLDVEQGETCLSMTVFPRLGCPDFSVPKYTPNPTDEGVTKSIFLPDEIIHNSHPRFRTLTKNIRKRKGEKVAINVPIFKDTNTPSPFIEKFDNDYDGESARAAKPDHIYMDCMGFGMGNCCLQTTFQACNITEGRALYDQLTPLTPILMALSGASPVFRGYLSDVDCRWDIISGSVDDRTREERGLEELKENRFRIPKSRYSTVDCYLSPAGDRYNDTDLVIDEDLCQDMINAGIDRQLARHVAHLFIRDPVSLFGERINQDDANDSDHFENIQSTNWQSMRFKPPPVNSKIGWRVEFRPIEVQLTDFENAAYVVFLVLLTRAILTFNINFLIPISKVDENMEKAQKRDAVLNQQFYFRKDIHSFNDTELQTDIGNCRDAEYYGSMSIDTIINGGPMPGCEEARFPGLIPLVYQYINTVEGVDVDTRCTISHYLKLISDRAAGRLKTTARWIRDFIHTHPDYKHDSVVSDLINYDLIKECDLITRGKVEAPDLFHTQTSRSSDDIPESIQIVETQIDTN
ncbi:glutamate--cysteine ligase catalytic subunit [Strongylocentrotus purpuratus]|uniref:Glutamate--cysteine ligase n=1 Tax=Strongylocentrotus purpuratus TaxID=7668 RepID=A0A7M7GGR3_STRPU|nr:glutamate--cysteine ligase catalytic subunit [Strongylocentrotus purpuratus]|eukprot:XP_003723283.1 PREDICTED: glutamate--cysteine ligase catalytic subunit isoform X1 [Strongylocentrotus purpuratus]